MNSPDTPPPFLLQLPPTSPNGGASFTFHASPSPAAPGFPSPPAEKPYHTKRPHKKSRTGCRNCKARKVKCDEARPSCRSCTLRKAECVYPTPTPASPKSGGSVNGNDSCSENDALVRSCSRSRSPLHPDTDELIIFGDLGQRPMGLRVDEMDMKLLWWYTTEAYASFAVNGRPHPPIESALKVQIVQLAFQHPFLMNTLLGMTSLHLQTFHKAISRVRALKYRAAAFEGYRQAVEEAKPETYLALLACSLLLCALSSHTFRESDTKPLYILDWMIVWRGIGLIVDMSTPKVLLESGLKQLFFRPKIDLDVTVSFIPSRLLFMVDSIPFTDPDYTYRDTYYVTLKYLGSLYQELQLSGFGPILDLRVITFFTFLPQAFVDLAREKRPRALIILAYYLMFMGHVQHVWWVQGIGDREIKYIAEELGEEWEMIIQVPVASMSVTDQIDRARLILENQEWRPPKGGRYELEDHRFQELGWVDDRGREVIIETGEVIIPRSQATVDTTTAVVKLTPDDEEGDETTSQNGPNADAIATAAQDQPMTIDHEVAVYDKKDDITKAIIPHVDDDVMQPIPFYTR